MGKSAHHMLPSDHTYRRNEKDKGKGVKCSEHEKAAQGTGEELAYSYRVQPGLPGALSETGLRNVQLTLLNESLRWAREHCSFYHERLPDVPLASLEAVQTLPLMDETAFTDGLASLLGIQQNTVSRIVTVPTSGTTGEPKRIAFTEQEHRDTVEYLASGMCMLAQPGETIAVLYPCERTGGLGRLICEGIKLVGRRAYAYGLPDERRGFKDMAKAFLDNQVRGVVGFPQHIYALAQWCRYHALELPIQNVLLSADNVAPSLKRCIAHSWDAQVFAHYGTTEMGYGGAVECGCGTGQHIRETDLLFEIIDPETGEVLPIGEWGELVFTTLNRHAMPFIRYRTGDISRLLPGNCECGSILRRIDAVMGRAHDQMPFTLYELEDMVFACNGVLDFSAHWNRHTNTVVLEVQVLLGTSPDFSELCDLCGERFKVTVQVHQVATNEFKPLYPAKRLIRHET